MRRVVVSGTEAVAANEPRATVVVPAHNGAATLGACLDALARQTVTGLDVIVVDDGSTDGSAQVAHGYGVRVVVQPRRGAAAARNAGIAVARGDVILFTDADCRPAPDWAERMLKAFDDERVAGCKGAYLSEQRSLVARFVQCEYEDRYRRTRRFDTIDFVDTYAAAYRRDVLLAVGGFDEGFAAASVEDQELSFRVASAGHRLVFVPDARVEHMHVDTVRGYVRKKFRIGADKVRVHRRHPRQLVRDSHTPTSVRLQMLLALVWLGALPVAIVSPRARLLAVGFPVALAVSALPLAVHNVHKDVVVGMLTPGLAVVRATALAAGLTCGAFQSLSGAWSGDCPRRA